MAKPKIDWSPENWPRLLHKLFTSYGLATTVLVFMTLVTLFGTYYQIDNGLFAAKQKYFHSYYIFHDLFGIIPVILPGGLLLMITLFINMVLGAIVKVKKRWRGAGPLISHCGMLMLLAGGYITHAFATDGYIALYPEMKSNRVQSYRKWQLEIIPVSEDTKAEKAWVIPTAALNKIEEGASGSIVLPELPFDVVVSNYAKNASPIPVSAPMAAKAEGKEIDGYKLFRLDEATEAAQNMPGCYVEFAAKKGKEKVEAILWAYSSGFTPGEKTMPFVFEIEGKKYAAQIAKKSWVVPFEVRLDKFIFDRHPGVSMARNYESRVTRLEKGQPDKALEIKMNEPMRYAGYTFFQESFGPANANPGDRMYSQFAVANNPADQWPLVALIITGIGLAIHFVIKLFEFINRSKRTRSAKLSSHES